MWKIPGGGGSVRVCGVWEFSVEAEALICHGRRAVGDRVGVVIYYRSGSGGTGGTEGLSGRSVVESREAFLAPDRASGGETFSTPAE
jgi:hypothetical protein